MILRVLGRDFIEAETSLHFTSKLICIFYSVHYMYIRLAVHTATYVIYLSKIRDKRRNFTPHDSRAVDALLVSERRGRTSEEGMETEHSLKINAMQ